VWECLQTRLTAFCVSYLGRATATAIATVRMNVGAETVWCAIYYLCMRQTTPVLLASAQVGRFKLGERKALGSKLDSSARC